MTVNAGTANGREASDATAPVAQYGLEGEPLDAGVQVPAVKEVSAEQALHGTDLHQSVQRLAAPTARVGQMKGPERTGAKPKASCGG